MALLVANKPFDAALTDITANILDLNAGPHSFTYTGYKQEIVVENNEAVPLTINLLGDGVSTYNCPGTGPEDVSGGVDFVVAAGATATITPSRRSGYMVTASATTNNVAITITGSTAPSLAFAWLNEYP